MILFTTSEYYKRFALALQEGAKLGKSEINRFPNGEMQAVVRSNVQDQDCLVIGSVAPPDEQLLALLSLTDALKRSGARMVRVFLPYLGYARQDKYRPGESSGITLVGSLLKAAGVDEIVVVDLHSERDKQLIGLPLVSLSSMPLFAPAITQNNGWKDATIVAPDEGAIHRARELAQLIESPQPVAHLKKRHTDGVKHLDLVGKVGMRAVLVDDVLDTGETLLSACMYLKDKGVQEMAVLVTHGLFTGDAWKRLFTLGITSLLVTDGHPAALHQTHPAIHVVPLAPLLAGGLAAKEGGLAL